VNAQLFLLSFHARGFVQKKITSPAQTACICKFALVACRPSDLATLCLLYFWDVAQACLADPF